MCIIVKSTWSPCGHRTQRIKRCELAGPLPETEVELDAGPPNESQRTPSATCPNTTTTFYTQRLTAMRVPPLCPVGPDCLPADYWSCCQCQQLPSAGAKGGKRGLRQKKQMRLARFAPSFNAQEAYDTLQTGDVCDGNMDKPTEPLAVIDEADETGEDHLEELDMDVHGPSGAMDIDCADEGNGVPPIQWDSCPMEGVVYGAETEPMDIDDGYDSAADSAADSDTTGITGIPDADSVLPRSTDCQHVRCTKCLQWRRCPCGCNCRKVTPTTRRRCQLCVRNKCRPHNPDMVVLPRRVKIKPSA